jgi:DNA-binding transcriptional LysR family regulator
VLAAYDGLQAEAAACRGNLVGTLRLGVVPLSDFDPLTMMQRLHTEHPSLRFELSSLSSERILEQLANNRIDLGISYLERLDNERFEALPFSHTRMGLLYDQRFFFFGEEPLRWESLVELPLGMLTSGMHFRQSIDHAFHSRGLAPQPLLQTDAVHQLLQAVHGGLCCAVVPLDSGLKVLTEELRIQPIENAQTLVPLGLIMRRGAPRSALAEACFALYQKSITFP